MSQNNGQTIVNRFGRLTGFIHIKVNALGRTFEGINAIVYGDEDDIKGEYGSGKFPIGWSVGTSEAKAAIDLILEEKAALVQALPAGMRLQDLVFDIVVVYFMNNQEYTDIIRNCIIKNNGVDVKSGDGKITFNHDIHCSHIAWNGIEPTV